MNRGRHALWCQRPARINGMRSAMPQEDGVEAVCVFFNKSCSWRALLIVHNRLIVWHVAEVAPSSVIFQQPPLVQRGKDRNLVFGIEEFLKKFLVSHRFCTT